MSVKDRDQLVLADRRICYTVNTAHFTDITVGEGLIKILSLSLYHNATQNREREKNPEKCSVSSLKN